MSMGRAPSVGESGNSGSSFIRFLHEILHPARSELGAHGWSLLIQSQASAPPAPNAIVVPNMIAPIGVPESSVGAGAEADEEASAPPVGIAGAYEAWPRSRPYPLPAPLFWPAGKGTIAVSIGQPIASRCFADKPRAQVLDDLFVRIEEVYERAERLRRKPMAVSNAESRRSQFRIAGQVTGAPEP